MVTVAQQTDPTKAKISSIGDQIDTPKAETATVATTPVAEPITPVVPTEKDMIDTPKKKVLKDKQGNTINLTETLKAQNAIPFAERVQKAEAESTAKAQTSATKLLTTDARTLATSYDSGSITALEIEALKTQDPLKYQEFTLALEKKRALEAINQNQETFMANYKQLTDTYMNTWQASLNDNTGAELRNQIFEQYGLNKSSEMIKNYTTQIDKIDDEMRNLEDWTGTGDAMLDRGSLIRKSRDLGRQRMDAIRARQAEVDYYRMGLERADAVVNDYKAEQGQRLEMMGKQFELATGMSQMEFQMKDQQNRDYLTQIDEDTKAVQQEIAIQEQKREDRIYAGSLLSLYDEFSNEDKAFLSTLPPERLEAVLKTYGDKVKAEEDRMRKEKDYEIKGIELDIKQKEFGLKQKELQIKQNESAMKNREVVKLDNGDIVLVDKSTGQTSQIYNTPSSSPIVLKENDIQSIIDFCVNNRGKNNIQCGELVNDYWVKTMGYKAGMGDSYESKVKAIQGIGQSQSPIEGGVFAFSGGKYGHTGIVTKVLDDGSIEVLEANRDGGNGSYPEINTYSAGKVKSMVFSMPPAKTVEYEVDFDAIQLPEKASEGKLKTLSFANRMRDAHEKLLSYDLENYFIDRSDFGQVWQENTFSVLQGNKQKDLEIYKEAFIAGILRQESGAAIANTEFSRYEKIYFPKPGDSKETLKQKQSMREKAIKQMYGQVGTDINRVPVSNYYDPSHFRSQIETINTPSTVYKDPIDSEFATYFGDDFDLLSTIQ